MWRGFQGRQAISGDSGTSRARARVDWAAGAEVALLGPSSADGFSAPSWGEQECAGTAEDWCFSLPQGKRLRVQIFLQPRFGPRASGPGPSWPGQAGSLAGGRKGRGGKQACTRNDEGDYFRCDPDWEARRGEPGPVAPPSGRDQRSCSVVTGQAPLMGVSLWGGTARDAAFLSWAGINPMVPLKCVLKF